MCTKPGRPLYISIHAPTRGATVILVCRSLAFTISIHAPTRGATGKDYFMGVYEHISIHAPTRGATDMCTAKYDYLPISIHAPTRGATADVEINGITIYDFNPRSHEGSDCNFRQKVLFSLSKNCLKYLILTTNYFN